MECRGSDDAEFSTLWSADPVGVDLDVDRDYVAWRCRCVGRGCDGKQLGTSFCTLVEVVYGVVVGMCRFPVEAAGRNAAEGGPEVAEPCGSREPIAERLLDLKFGVARVGTVVG